MESRSAHSRSFWFKLIPQPTGFDQPAFLYLLVICQAATILLTWPLWQVHRAPPMIPAVGLPEINTGVVLLITLAAIIIRPLPALILHTALVVYSILIDQTRLQPEIVSMVVLMWGLHRSFSFENYSSRSFGFTMVLRRSEQAAKFKLHEQHPLYELSAQFSSRFNGPLNRDRFGITCSHSAHP